MKAPWFTATGTHGGLPARITVGPSVVEADDPHVADLLRILAAEGPTVRYAGVWAGPATLSHELAARATVLDLLDEGSVRFAPDKLPPVPVEAIA